MGHIFKEKLSSKSFTIHLRSSRWQTASTSIAGEKEDFRAPIINLRREICNLLNLLPWKEYTFVYFRTGFNLKILYFNVDNYMVNSYF